MAMPAGSGIQSPLNLILPIRSWLEAKGLDAVVHLKTRDMVKAADEVGTLHFARFVDFHDHNQIGFFTAYDGDFRKYIQDFIRSLAPIFNAIFPHVVSPPPLPVEKNAEAFIDWIAAHNLDGIGFYSAYPTLSVQDIKARAGQAPGAVGKGVQSPFTLVLPVQSPTQFMALGQLLASSLPTLYAAADAIGTLHFARFVQLGTSAVGFVSEYDGEFDKYIEDFAMHLGPFFDAVFENVVDPPPTPVQKNTRAFIDWIAKHNKKPWVFYSAYPRLSVQDIRAGATLAA